MSQSRLAARHFKAVCPYTRKDITDGKHHQFQATLPADQNGASEKVSFDVPVLQDGDNLEKLIREVIPNLKKSKNSMQWTWAVTFDRLHFCLDEEFSDKWATICREDYPNNAQRTEANFRLGIRRFCDDALNHQNCRDDVVELLQTGCKKAADVMPHDHWERMKQLKRVTEWTRGLENIPSDDALKVYFFRSMPQSLQSTANLHGYSAASDIDELKEHLDAAHTEWALKNNNKRGRTNDGNDNGNSNGQGSGNRRRTRTRYDYSNNRNGGGGRGNRRGYHQGGRGGGHQGRHNRTRFDDHCPRHPHLNHTWGECFDNPDGRNFRRSNGNRGRGNYQGGRGNRGGGSNNSYQGSHNQNDRQDAHHVSNGQNGNRNQQGSGQSSNGNQNNMPPRNINVNNAADVAHVDVDQGAASLAESSLFSRSYNSRIN